MNRIENNLTFFRAIGLETLNSLELMKRHDTKYIFHKDKLLSIFEYLHEYYDILEINKKRCFMYKNLYFDTDDYFFYHQHHNQRVNRNKVRYRRYIDSGKCFLEVKLKNNRRKTIKNRLLLKDANFSSELCDESLSFVKKYLMNGESIIHYIIPKLHVDYSRITLANQFMKERLTFDLDLTYTDNHSNCINLDNLVIAELKQEHFSQKSPFVQCFRNLKIFPVKFSKYCMGVALTNRNVKTNRFKKKLLTLQKLN